MEIIRDMHSRSLHRIQSRWLQERYHREDSLWRYHIMHGNFQVAKDGYLHLKNTNLRSCEESLKHAIKELDAINNNESSWQSVNHAKLNELNMKLLTIQYKDSIDRLSKRIEELTHEKEKWLSIMSTCPLKERDRLILVYERNLREVEKIFNNDVTHVKEIQKTMPRSIPLLDNLERIVIRRGDENWKQIQTHMDEFFKTKGYHRKSDREKWERAWCIVETENFWIIMELDESGITNEHLNDYDQLSKHLTKALVTSGFFLYSFEFSESLARLYNQGECVDHWVIDEGLEVDEQEICQPLAWESSKIANPYRMKDPEEVHLIDILYDWMEMLKINPQWMVEEVDSTQNFKKCHIFGYAIVQ
ncbi:MAG: hypothetical protein Q7I98_06815, partial [Erysipelotrichaceae bacterium]|nr:hypothetical protein [Erysipelotrichaceae bacterium]